MATKRTRLRRHRVGGDAEYQAWSDAFMTGDEFSAFLTEQDERVANVLKTLGLA